MNRTVRSISIFAALGVLVLLCLIGLFFMERESNQTTNEAEVQGEVIGVGHTDDVTENGSPAPTGQTAYRNEQYRFTLLYPSAMDVSEYAESDGAMTVIFQDVKNVRGFQVYVTPYTQPQVTEERFTLDNPSGVRKNLENIVIDGAIGAAFYSSNASLGEMREVWFIKNGYLYEVTTIRALDPLIEQVMQTWKFL